MAGIKIYTADFNGIRVQKTVSVADFQSWIISTLGGGTSNNDIIYDVHEGSDGSIYSVGYEYTTNSPARMPLMVKYDSSLNVIQQTHLSTDTGQISTFDAIVPSYTNEFVAVGQVYTATDSSEAFICDSDGNLNILAQKVTSGSGGKRFYDVIQGDNNSYVAVGTGFSDGFDALIVKFDQNLNILNTNFLSGQNDNEFHKVVQVSDGYVAMGIDDSESTFGYGFVAKFDNSLNLVSKKYLNPTASMTRSFFGDICSTPNGFAVVGSGYYTDHSEGLVFEFDKDLNVLNQKKIYNGTTTITFRGVHYDNGLVMVGVAQNNPDPAVYTGVVLKLDSNLNITSSVGLESSVNFYHVSKATDGSYLISGLGSVDSTGPGTYDAMTIKISNNFTNVTGSAINHSVLSWGAISLTSANEVHTFSDPTQITESAFSTTMNNSSFTFNTINLTETRSEKQ